MCFDTSKIRSGKMSKQLLKFGAAIEGVSTRKDKTLTVRLGTQELPGETAGQLFGMQNAFVYVALKEEDFGRDEIEALEALEADALYSGYLARQEADTAARPGTGGGANP